MDSKSVMVRQKPDEEELSQLCARVQKMRELQREAEELRLFMRRYIDKTRCQSPRFYFLSEKQLVGLLTSITSLPDAQSVVQDCFTGLQSVKLLEDQQSSDEVISIQHITNWYGEELYPDGVSVSKSKVLAKYENQLTGEELPLVKLITLLDRQSKVMIKKNILQNYLSVAKLNFDFVSMTKLFQKKQIYFQCLYVLIDICFYYDLTALLRQSYEQRLNQQDLNELSNFNGASSSQIQQHQQQANRELTEKNIAKCLKQFQERLQSSLTEFLDFKNTKTSQFFQKNTYAMFNQLVLQVLSQIEILQSLRQLEVSSTGQFEYIGLPKFSLEIPKLYAAQFLRYIEEEGCQSMCRLPQRRGGTGAQDQPPPSLSDIEDDAHERISNSPFTHFLQRYEQQHLLDIVLISMNYKLCYSYEVVDNLHNFVYTPSCQRLFFQVMSAISTASGVLVKSTVTSGKSTIVKTLSTLLARQLYSIQLDENANELTLIHNFTGACEGGYWILCDNLENMQKSVLSIFNQLILAVRRAVFLSQPSIELQSQVKTPFNAQAGVFASFTHCDQRLKFSEISPHLLENFRVLSVSEPEINIIIRFYCIILGVEQPERCAHQLIYFMKAMQSEFFVNLHKKLDFTYDRGEEYTHFLTIKGVILIMKSAIEIVRVKQLENEQIIPFDALKVSLDQYFKQVLNHEMFELYQQMFEQFFAGSKVSLLVSDILESKRYLDPIREYFIIHHMTLQESFMKTASNFINSVHWSKNLIVSGACGSGKSRLIEICSFIESRLAEQPFCVNIFPLDAIEPGQFLGYLDAQQQEWHDGLLQKVLDTISCDKGKLSEERKQFLVDYQKVLHRSSMKYVLDEKRRVVRCAPRDASRSYLSERDWIVLDCGSQNSSLNMPYTQYVERLLIQIEQRYMTLYGGRIAQIKNPNKFIFEVQDLSQLSPRSISGYSLVYLHDEIFEIGDQFSTWLRRTVIRQPKFAALEPYVRFCFEHLFTHALDYVFQAPQSEIYFRLSKKHLYHNFLNVFEILLNEVRKRDLAIGLMEWSEYAQLSLEQKLSCMDLMQLSVISNTKRELEGFQQLKIENCGISNERLRFVVESVCVFAILYGLGNSLQEKAKFYFSTFLVERIRAYVNLEVVQIFYKKEFGFNLLSLIALEKTQDNLLFNLFDYQFDISKLRWVKWIAFKTDNHLFRYITPDIQKSVLPFKEIARLNERAAQLDEIKNDIETDYNQNIVDYTQNLVIETTPLKIASYLVMLALFYNKKVLLAGQPKSSKSAFLYQNIFRLQKKNQSAVFYLQMTSQVSSQLFQSLISKSLLPKAQSNASERQFFVIIDDLHLAQLSQGFGVFGQARCLVEYQGLYAQGGFRRFHRFGMLASVSADSRHGIDIFDAHISDIPSALIHKCFVLRLQEMNQEDLISISKIFSEQLFRFEIGLSTQDEQLFDSFIRYTLLICNARPVFNQLSRKYNVNLNFQLAFNIIQFFEKFDILKTAHHSIDDSLAAFIFLFNTLVAGNFIIDQSKKELIQQQTETDLASASELDCDDQCTNNTLALSATGKNFSDIFFSSEASPAGSSSHINRQAADASSKADAHRVKLTREINLNFNRMRKYSAVDYFKIQKKQAGGASRSPQHAQQQATRAQRSRVPVQQSQPNSPSGSESEEKDEVVADASFSDGNEESANEEWRNVWVDSISQKMNLQRVQKHKLEKVPHRLLEEIFTLVFKGKVSGRRVRELILQRGQLFVYNKQTFRVRRAKSATALPKEGLNAVRENAASESENENENANAASENASENESASSQAQTQDQSYNYKVIQNAAEFAEVQSQLVEQVRDFMCARGIDARTMGIDCELFTKAYLQTAFCMDLKQCHIQFEFDWQVPQEAVFFRFICHQNHCTYHEVALGAAGCMDALRAELARCYEEIVVEHAVPALHVYFAGADAQRSKECINLINTMLNCSNFWAFMQPAAVARLEAKIRENQYYEKCNLNQIHHICMYMVRSSIKLVFVLNTICIEHAYLETFQNFFTNFIRINKMQIHHSPAAQYQLLSHAILQKQVLTLEELAKVIKVYNVASILRGGQPAARADGAYSILEAKIQLIERVFASLADVIEQRIQRKKDRGLYKQLADLMAQKSEEVEKEVHAQEQHIQQMQQLHEDNSKKQREEEAQLQRLAGSLGDGQQQVADLAARIRRNEDAYKQNVPQRAFALSHFAAFLDCFVSRFALRTPHSAYFCVPSRSPQSLAEGVRQQQSAIAAWPDEQLAEALEQVRSAELASFYVLMVLVVLDSEFFPEKYGAPTQKLQEWIVSQFSETVAQQLPLVRKRLVSYKIQDLASEQIKYLSDSSRQLQVYSAAQLAQLKPAAATLVLYLNTVTQDIQQFNSYRVEHAALTAALDQERAR